MVQRAEGKGSWFMMVAGLFGGLAGEWVGGWAWQGIAIKLMWVCCGSRLCAKLMCMRLPCGIT
jgi:hypothetical protein